MKKVLIITYYWPPASGPGVQRWLKFVKYLPEFGWKPLILTVKDGSYPATDDSLSKDVPNDIPVFKTNTLEPFTIYNMLRGKKGKKVEPGLSSIKDKKGSFYQKIAAYIRANFFIPDARIGWRSYAVKEVKKILETHKIDVIVTTSPPHSAQLIGLDLKKKHNIPWVADFRDPWVNIYSNQLLNLNDRVKQKNIEYENKVLTSSDKVLVVGDSMRTEFSDRNSNVHVLYNGFDPTDLSEAPIEATDTFTLRYVGKISPLQNIPNLWKAINELRLANEDFNKYFRISFVGMTSKPIQDSITEADLLSICTFSSFIPHQEAVEKMMCANMLLLVIPNTPKNECIITGKIFEYLASQTPILGVGPTKGDAAIVLQKCERDPMIDFEDLAGFKKMLLSHFNYWLEHQKISLKNKNDLHLQFSRRKLTKGLVNLLNDLS